jgi:hypothetical protein
VPEFRTVTAEEFERVVVSEECDVELNDTDPPTLVYTQVSTGQHIATKVLHYDPVTPGAFYISG